MGSWDQSHGRKSLRVGRQRRAARLLRSACAHRSGRRHRRSLLAAAGQVASNTQSSARVRLLSALPSHIGSRISSCAAGGPCASKLCSYQRSDHTAAIKRPYGLYGATVLWPLSSDHMASIERPHGLYRATIWPLSSDHTASIERPYGTHMPSIERPYGLYRATI